MLTAIQDMYYSPPLLDNDMCYVALLSQCILAVGKVFLSSSHWALLGRHHDFGFLFVCCHDLFIFSTSLMAPYLLSIAS